VSSGMRVGLVLGVVEDDNGSESGSLPRSRSVGRSLGDSKELTRLCFDFVFIVHPSRLVRR
jgi:hypothetical protein